MKAVVTILFSLALVLSHLSVFASPVKQLCQNKTPCGCGDSSCCVKATDATPKPVTPAPAPDTSRTQLLAAFQAVAQFVPTQPAAAAATAFLPLTPAPAAIPLYVRNCSYLI